MPSSLRQICSTASRLASVTANPGWTDAARSANSRTASYCDNDSVDSRERPGSGSGSVGTASVCSPPMPRACRLVARIRRSGAERSSVCATTAQSGSRCSQLSSPGPRSPGHREVSASPRSGRQKPGYVPTDSVAYGLGIPHITRHATAINQSALLSLGPPPGSPLRPTRPSMGQPIFNVAPSGLDDRQGLGGEVDVAAHGADRLVGGEEDPLRAGREPYRNGEGAEIGDHPQ